MNKWKKINEKDEDLIEIKIKIPKNTICMVINYLEQCNGILKMGNMTFDEEDTINIKNGVL